MNSPIKLPAIPYELLETLSDGEVPLVRAYAEQAVRPYIAALERIASEEFISLGEGNVDVRPVISDREACNLARVTLMNAGSSGHKPTPVDTSPGHSFPVAGEADNTDYIGLALELESAAKRVESQTVQRAIDAGAHGLRLAHSFRNAAPQASAPPKENPNVEGADIQHP
ncbi:hypothetical protein ACOTF6_09390 [Achromobacter xylosoxidans]